MAVAIPRQLEWYKCRGPAGASSNFANPRSRVVDFDVKARLGNLAVATVASPAGEGPSAIPQSQLAEEMSIPNPVVEPGPIQTLSAEEITRFFVRSRRDPDPERWDVRLDATLRESWRAPMISYPRRPAAFSSTIPAPPWPACAPLA